MCVCVSQEHLTGTTSLSIPSLQRLESLELLRQQSLETLQKQQDSDPPLSPGGTVSSPGRTLEQRGKQLWQKLRSSEDVVGRLKTTLLAREGTVALALFHL